MKFSPWDCYSSVGGWNWEWNPWCFITNSRQMTRVSAWCSITQIIPDKWQFLWVETIAWNDENMTIHELAKPHQSGKDRAYDGEMEMLMPKCGFFYIERKSVQFLWRFWRGREVGDGVGRHGNSVLGMTWNCLVCTLSGLFLGISGGTWFGANV